MRSVTLWLAPLLVALAVPRGPGFPGGPARALAQGLTRATPPSGARIEPGMLAALQWRSIGPANTGGRIDDFAVARVRGAPDAIYVATASGGLFKSLNNGTSWSPIFDRVDAMMSIGDVAVAPSNPNVVWVGTGEANNRQSSSWGDGLYKSVDGGRTWRFMGLRETRHIGRIIIHPSDPDIVYVAAVGHLWGPNAERGVFKTTDGGETWNKVLYVNEQTGANDIVMDPQDPQALFASTYQRQRKAWGFNGGGPGSGIYRSYDGGATWTRLSNGLPAGDKGRIGLDIFQGDGRIVYATVEAGVRPDGTREGGVYGSTDRGESWEQLNTLSPRPSYYSQIRVDPKDASRVYLLGSNRGFYVSDDGGRNFGDIFSAVHGEDHALWIDPDDPNHLIVGGDGGVSISWDRGLTWLFRDNLPIGQFYEISTDMNDPYTVCGGLQDNGNWCVPSATRLRTGISNRDAYNIGLGDGFYTEFDPNDPSTVVIEWQNGRASRVNLATLERQGIAPRPQEKPTRGESTYRWNWDTPILPSSVNPAVLYIGANVLFRSPDRGVSWTVISPDLTTNADRTKLEMMGVRVTERTLSRNDGVSSYATLTTIGESPFNAAELYTGSDDGQVYVTRDGGGTWTNVTPRVPGLPPNTYVSSVVPSYHAAGRVYVTFDGHYNDDYRPYVYVSEDYGQTWRSLAAGLPETSVNRLREHLRNPRFLVLGHERGVHFSTDGGASWISLATNMPTVSVDDIVIHPRENDVIVGTHGRGIWILDGIGPLEALTPDVLRADATLMPISRARLLRMYYPQAWYGAGQFFGPNPEYGAAITYYLREAGAGPVHIAISDAEENLLRMLDGPSARGLNRIAWDLRMEPPIPGEVQPPAPGDFGGSPTGPLVVPGKYSVTVKVPGLQRELKGDVVVEGDPRIAFSDSDRRAKQVALLDLYENQKTLGTARGAVQRLAGQIEAMKKDLASARAGRPAGSSDSLGLLDKLAERVTQLQGDIQSRLSTATDLARAIEGYSGVPTRDQHRELDWTFEDATKAVEDLNRLLQTEVPTLYVELVKQGMWPTRPEPLAAPVRRP